jgi:hypothetical protein
MKLKLFIAALASGIIILSVGSSCQKKTDCKLIVITHDSVGNVLPAATVKLFVNVKTSTGAVVRADLKAEGVSDGSGSSTYTFKLPAILDVNAISVARTGVGVVKLEEGKTVEKIIVLK